MTISGFYFEKKYEKNSQKSNKVHSFVKKITKKRNNIEEQKVTAPEDIVFSE